MGTVAEKRGNKAVIHTAAASAVGGILTRHFKQKGINVNNVTRREGQIECLKKEGADYVLNSQGENSEERLKQLAEKENATLAFDAVAGDLTHKKLASQPTGSKCLACGGFGGANVQKINIMELFKSKALGGLYVTNPVEEYAQKSQLTKLATELYELLPTTFRTHIHKVFKLGESKEAVTYYAANSSKGKVVFKPN